MSTKTDSDSATATATAAATTTTTTKKRKRLNLDLSSEAYALLQKLSDESGKNMADVLRTGLALYGIASEEKEKGRSLSISKDDKVIKDIVLT
ncbi:MAG: hypothetical protein F6K65_32320 [Moorea sp. SIO3C2]|nr:hypothetical protein [Moorena sp. SIO3C2]